MADVTFSHKIKDELSALISEENARLQRQCWVGMLFMARERLDGFSMRSEHREAARLFFHLTQVFAPQYNPTISQKGGETFIVSLSPESDSANIYHLQDNPAQTGPAFLAGAFLAAGNLSDPKKDYHLEFICHNQASLPYVSRALEAVGVAPKVLERKGSSVVYIKESEQIEDVLTYMGAVHSSLEVMNVKILKDVRNKANRIANCDSANIEKTVAASAKQTEDIRRLEVTLGLDKLPYSLRQLAELRLENPELSLRELGLLLDKPIGRSGVGRRLKKISEIVAQMNSEN